MSKLCCVCQPNWGVEGPLWEFELDLTGGPSGAHDAMTAALHHERKLKVHEQCLESLKEKLDEIADGPWVKA